MQSEKHSVKAEIEEVPSPDSDAEPFLGFSEGHIKKQSPGENQKDPSNRQEGHIETLLNEKSFGTNLYTSVEIHSLPDNQELTISSTVPAERNSDDRQGNSLKQTFCEGNISSIFIEIVPEDVEVTDKEVDRNHPSPESSTEGGKTIGSNLIDALSHDTHKDKDNELLEIHHIHHNNSNSPSSSYVDSRVGENVETLAPVPGVLTKKRPINDPGITPDLLEPKRKRTDLFTHDTGPHWYDVRGDIVTAPIILKHLPNVFEYLPAHGKPSNKRNLDKFLNDKLRDYVGCDLGDVEYNTLQKYCSIDHLKVGKELSLNTESAAFSILPESEIPEVDPKTTKLCALKKYLSLSKEVKAAYMLKFKYRGLRMLPIAQEDLDAECELEPGRDILIRVRVYRPYIFYPTRSRNVRGRHSVFNCDMVLLGRQPLSALRDRIVCHNDVDMRLDVSDAPDQTLGATAKESFPSGFLFINNAFYVDTRVGCSDHSAVIREWAKKKKIGDFPKYDMCTTTLDQLVIKLGHPEVYMHQGNCEHVFTFSEARLLSAGDSLQQRQWPQHGWVSQIQSLYCTTCAEFTAKWLVRGCTRVPFDPAFFCEPCFRQYLYVDGRKVGSFRAYSYRGNELNMLKPVL